MVQRKMSKLGAEISFVCLSVCVFVCVCVCVCVCVKTKGRESADRSIFSEL